MWPEIGRGVANFGAPLDPWRSFSRSTHSCTNLSQELQCDPNIFEILLLLCDLRHPKQTMYKFVVCAKRGVSNLVPKIFEILLLSCDLRHRNQAMYKFVVWSAFWVPKWSYLRSTAASGLPPKVSLHTKRYKEKRTPNFVQSEYEEAPLGVPFTAFSTQLKVQ